MAPPPPSEYKNREKKEKKEKKKERKKTQTNLEAPQDCKMLWQATKEHRDRAKRKEQARARMAELRASRKKEAGEKK